jgi:hypothetical protein
VLCYDVQAGFGLTCNASYRVECGDIVGIGSMYDAVYKQEISLEKCCPLRTPFNGWVGAASKYVCKFYGSQFWRLAHNGQAGNSEGHSTKA